MLNIRNSIFETNSSSTHSLCLVMGNEDGDGYFYVPKKCNYCDIPMYLDPEQNIIYVSNEYVDTGWGPYICIRPEQKFVYLLISRLNRLDFYDVKSANEALRNYEKFDELTEIIEFARKYIQCYSENDTTIDTIQFFKPDSDYNDVRIDHQSRGVIEEEMRVQGLSLKDVILSHKYSILCYNDNM